MTRWSRWKRLRRTRTRYILTPGQPRITAAGLRGSMRVRMIEITDPRWF